MVKHSSKRSENSANDVVKIYIEMILKKVGINLKRLGIAGRRVSIVTDTDIPENIKLDIHQYTATKGLDVDFFV
ncbi:MAG: hypothetical protein ACYS9Y_00165 [Planctomycetota bacterium]|jgi:hypothetical protein